MKTILDPDLLSEPIGPLVATIGNFDGVHRGHQWVIGNVRRRAAELNAGQGHTPAGIRPIRSAVITFDPHPSRALRPELAHSLITPLAQKLALLEETGVDLAVVLPFTRELAGTSALAFAEDILRDRLDVVELHEGENFRFGYNAEADIHTLTALGKQLGFRTVLYPAQARSGSSISSSRIRRLLAAGDVAAARRLLGRPLTIESTPAPGRGYGTRYTVPTINLAPYDELLPANGVYVTELAIGSGADAERFDAVTNIGNRPTFGADSFTVESHLLDFHAVALTETTPLRLSFLHRLRPEMRWPSPELLRAQIGKDVDQARRFFSLCRVLRPQSPATQPGRQASPAGVPAPLAALRPAD